MQIISFGDYAEKRRCSASKDLDKRNMILSIILFVLYGITSVAIPPNPLYIPPNDSLSMFENRASTLNYAWVILFVFGGQLLLALGANHLSEKYPSFFRDCNPYKVMWGLCICFCTTGIITSIFKAYVGRARPDVYDVCGKEATYETCKETGKFSRNDEFFSWPSGHASTAISGTLYMSLFLNKCIKHRHLGICIAVVMILCFGIYSGATRIVDFRHHTDDVAAGLFVGFIVTYLIWNNSEEEVFSEDNEMESMMITVQTVDGEA